MMSKNAKALDKLHSIVKPDPGTWKKEAQWRHENKTWIRKSQKIAFKILRVLREQKKTQKELAGMMNVSPQQVNKWVKGKENFTLETLSRIEEALEINLLAIDNSEKMNLRIKTHEIRVLPAVSRTAYNSIINKSVKSYIESKRPDTPLNIYCSNYSNTAEYLQSIIKRDFERFSELKKDLSHFWTFETKANEGKVIEIKPESKYKKRINLDDFLVAEPEEDYY